MLNTCLFYLQQLLVVTHISHEEFFSVNNVWREYNEIKEEIKKS